MKMILPLVLTCPLAVGSSFGNLQQSSIQDEAIICMAIGVHASLSGLDDMFLLPIDTDGTAGALYSGSDKFMVESNDSLVITASGSNLQNGEDQVATWFFVDGQLGGNYQGENNPGQQEHELTIMAQLANISSQQSGFYQTSVTLTLQPDLGANDGCGAQQLTFPVNNSDATAYMAWEDLYPYAGDADYNDFVMSYQATESFNASGGLESISLLFNPEARGAGYNHSVWLDMDGLVNGSKNIEFESEPLFYGDALIKVSYTNIENGNVVYRYFDKEDDVVLFHNTRATLDGFANVYPDGEHIDSKWKTSVEITLSDPSLNLLSDRGPISESSYRVYLSVMQTNKEIDLAAVNSEDGMIDSNGYPFGIVVPDNWQWPNERIQIDDAYPHFSEYRAWLAGETDTLSPEAEFWYTAPSTDTNLTHQN